MQITHTQAISILRREAKRLHKLTQSESHSHALPVLRRLIAAQAIRGFTLPDLRRQCDIIQRKHLLTLLAKEKGHQDWASYKASLEAMSDDELVQHTVLMHKIGYPNLWFSTLEEAADYSQIHGGIAVEVGEQAMVVVDEMLHPST
ncbi:hypothetical protein [Thaumasiovibrio subtropicus]|uniref:hypothetical protein n=1 Tax=Thaumasiovibrio subtropicus TaxID=1891207 RepID=UPI000B35BD18|nr:hypothetical protein [Thaumasiovibrio subtropicus]